MTKGQVMFWGTQGRPLPTLLSPGSQGRAQGLSSQRNLPLGLLPRTLQAASFITPIWTVLFLVAALDCRDTSPIPTLELVPTAGAQRCQESTRGECQGQCDIGPSLLPLPPPYPISTPARTEPVAELGSPQRTPGQGTSSVQTGRLKLREEEGLTQGHTRYSGWQNQD